ncbi:elongation factor 4 [Patescibacteria group bacterium]|jgi:GTP-binding protein LepA|nr:elongation factor 4 [Patescibacteria group bacterium]
MQQIRNFSIIAHIDHGKSTLADRMLEETKTIEARQMKDQLLDSMELERERGITIKMAPVRMVHEKDGQDYIINLIDTPGHIDFAYEVSRALKAVEGVVLLVDATQGVQAQTLSVLAMAREQNLLIIPVLSKVDAPHARLDEVKLELASLLDCDIDDVFETSGKTGQGVHELLDAIVARVPSPQGRHEHDEFRSLVFDFEYSNHRGVIVYVRLFDGSVKKGEKLKFANSNESFTALEVGTFSPRQTSVASLSEGEIGYLVTGIKEPGVASVGDTILLERASIPPLSGYQTPVPVVWASLYPESQDDFVPLRQALDRLRLSDSSLSFEEETSGVLGRGFRCGFLGMLHLEIVTERLRREFDLDLIVTAPSIVYEVDLASGARETVYSPHKFPDHGVIREIFEPWARVQIIAPPEYTGVVVPLLHEHEGVVLNTETLADGRTLQDIEMPLRELMRNFFDKLKSATSGYASISYALEELRHADVTRMDVLVAEEPVPAFTRVVSKRRVQEEAEAVVERLYETMPRQQFVTKIQAAALGRIISSKTLSAYRKDVTAKLYGGDVTRKMKLLEKQKKGKKKMAQRGKVDIPQEVFMKMMKGE